MILISVQLLHREESFSKENIPAFKGINEKCTNMSVFYRSNLIKAKLHRACSSKQERIEKKVSHFYVEMMLHECNATTYFGHFYFLPGGEEISTFRNNSAILWWCTCFLGLNSIKFNRIKRICRTRWVKHHLIVVFIFCFGIFSLRFYMKIATIDPKSD